jgi:tetratricopeptide (TPR) repeat protein
MDCKDLTGQSSVLRARAHLSGRLNNRRLAIKLAREAVGLARRCDDKKAEAESLVELGEQLHLQQGASRQATQHLEAAVSLFTEIGDIRGQARALLWLGEQARVAHRNRHATELLTQAKEKFEECSDKIGTAIVLSQLGELMVQHGDPDGGRKRLLEALILFEADDTFAGIHGAGNVYRSLAQSKLLRGEKDAEEDLQRALDRFQIISDKQAIAHVTRLFGQLAMRRRDDESAMRCFLEAGHFYEQVSDRIGMAHVKMFTGELDLRRGAVGKGVKSISEALNIYRDLGDPLGEGNTLHILGDVALRAGDLAEAGEKLTAALRRHETAGDVLATAHDKVSLAELALARGNFALARNHLNAANKIYQALDYKIGIDRLSRIQHQIDSTSQGTALS